MSKHTWITVDFHDEQSYHNLLDECAKFIAVVTAFLIAVGLKLAHKPGCPGGYSLTRHSHYTRKRLNGLTIYRVQCKLCKAAFTVLPHFVLPYRALSAEDAKRALAAYYRGLSLQAVEDVVGGISDSALYRLVCAQGREGVVEPLLKAGLRLPEDFEADEKHSACEGQKLYLPTVTAGPVVWSLACCDNKSAPALTQGYRVFQQAALAHEPDWQPKGILCDGFESTWQALHALFPSVPIANCLRHALDGLGKKLKGIAQSKRLCLNFWHLFDGRARGLIPVFSLGQRLRRFVEEITNIAGTETGQKIREWIERKKPGWFVLMRNADLPLTSVMLDQFHNTLARKLFAMKDFHHAGIDRQAFLSGLVLLHDLMPYMRRSRHPGKCPVEVAGGRMPTDDWFLNLRILTSGGFT